MTRWIDPGAEYPWLIPAPDDDPQPQPPTQPTTDRTQLDLFPQQDTHKND